jgi:DNA helicase-2/ATP-dependent DNA helicase PcrA
MDTPLNRFIATELNEQQRQAVLQKQGPLVVIAGAGSGKTRVITARIAHLMLNEQVPADAIVALTFTNKAAREMQERIGNFLPKGSALPFIGTFHSYCLRLLKSNPHVSDMPFFTILDADDQEKIIKDIIARNGIERKISPKQLLYQISALKNMSYTAEHQNYGMPHEHLLQQIFQCYEQEKRASRALDFDDLLHYGLQLFTHASFKTEFQQMVRHVLVDEYQDTNIIQHELLKAMAKDAHNKFAIDSLCIVGDEDQSIYSWRGATITNMLNFSKDFSNTATIKIEQNYRSVQSILDIANYVIQHNQQRSSKKLWSTKQGVDRIKNIVCMSEYQEGDVIAAIGKILQQQQQLGTCAILYRTHFQSRAIEEALIRANVPYRIFGGVQFYERKEIKDLLAFARLVANPFDRPAFFRVINVPPRGLGTAFETEFYERWATEPFCTFVQIAQQCIALGIVKQKKAAAVLEFIAIFADLSLQTAPLIAFEQIIKRSGYLEYIKTSEDPEEAQARLDNIQELMRAIEHFEREGMTTLEQLLDEIALMQERSARNQDDAEALTLMTLHAAKGLEFDTVILAGLEDGLLPSSRSLENESAVEEERRLFYVGITRAKERLLLSRSRYRYTYGQMTDQMQSRFLREIPPEITNVDDIRHMQPYQIKQFFGRWLTNASILDAPILTFGTPSYQPAQSIPAQHVAAPTSASTTFKAHQPVSHATFGVGIVQAVEQKDEKLYVSVKFKGGLKKVLAQFLKAV